MVGGRQPSVEADIQWKTTFVGRQPLMEDTLRWKTTFSGRLLFLDPCMLPTSLCGIFLKKQNCELLLQFIVRLNVLFLNEMKNYFLIISLAQYQVWKRITKFQVQISINF